MAGVTSQPGAFHPGQQGQCPGPPQLPPGLSLASLHSRGCVAPAFPATGLNGPRALPPPGTGWHLPLSGPPFQGNKPDPVAASCPCCEPTCRWAVVPPPLPRAGPFHRGHCQGRAGGQASCGLAPTLGDAWRQALPMTRRQDPAGEPEGMSLGSPGRQQVVGPGEGALGLLSTLQLGARPTLLHGFPVICSWGTALE